MPRKFNVAFDSGGAISVVADTNDIAFIATRVSEGRSVPAGVYFRVQLCGITGHRQFASDCGMLLTPGQTVAVAAAMIRVFNDNGDRTDRKKARLKYLIDRWGVEKFLEETEKRLAFPLMRFPLAECEPRAAGRSARTSWRSSPTAARPLLYRRRRSGRAAQRGADARHRRHCRYITAPARFASPSGRI